MNAPNDHWPDILVAYGTFVLAALSPGPALLSTMSAAMSHGRRTGVMVGLGVACGSFTWGLLASAGLSFVVTAFPGALTTIRMAGAGYLLFLAYRALRSATASEGVSVVARRGDRSAFASFLRGWGIHMTNPKGLFAWIAVISIGYKPGAPSWVAMVILAGATTFAVLYYTLAAVVFSVPGMVRAYSRAHRWIDGILGVIYVAAAWKLVGT